MAGMSGYDFYIMLRGIDELLERFLPILIIAAVGVVAAVLLRIWVRRNAPHHPALAAEVHALKKRVVSLEARLNRLTPKAPGRPTSGGQASSDASTASDADRRGS